MPSVVVVCAIGIGFQRWCQKLCGKHDHLLITSGLTIWVALQWPPCGHDFPIRYIGISDLGSTDKKVPPKTANQDLICSSRMTSTSGPTTSSNRANHDLVEGYRVTRSRAVYKIVS